MILFILKHDCHWNFKWSKTLQGEGDWVDLEHYHMEIGRFAT